MKIGTFKKLIENIPDDVELWVTDIANFESDFELSTYKEGDIYVDIIMSKYIISYSDEDNVETFYPNC